MNWLNLFSRCQQDLKIKKGFTKWILRKAIQTWLPAEIAWRKDKTAYEPPQKKWLQDRAIKEMIIESRKELVKRGVLLKESTGPTCSAERRT
jgi:asparagine synthase (glutamine-hydrolysing)